MNYEIIKPLFNGNFSDSQMNGLQTIIQEAGNIGTKHLAYILATIYHETGRKMQPVKEFGNESYLRSKPYYPYYGRGHIQLTWDYNYKKFGNLLGIDLFDNPDLALVPEHSINIAFIGMTKGLFTSKKLSDFFNDTITDWIWARSIINGKRKGESLPDRAEDIAEYGKLFYQALKD